MDLHNQLCCMHADVALNIAWPLPSIQVATIMLIFIMGLAYAPTSPIILPFTLLYFFNSWYVSEPHAHPPSQYQSRVVHIIMHVCC